MAASSIVPVDFHGTSLITVTIDGSHYVAIKPICEALTVNAEGQRARINRHPVLSKGAIVTKVPSAGGKQEAVCLPLDMLNGWLFGISAARVRDPARRERLIDYQRECFDVLARHFGAASALTQKPEPSTDPERIKLAQSLATEAASTVSSEVSRAVFNEAVATGNSRHGSWKINRWILSFEYDEETKDYTRPVVRAEVERRPEELIEMWLSPDAHIFDTEFLGRLQQTCAARIFRAYEYQKARATGKNIKPSWGIPLAPSVKSSIGA